MEYTHTEIELVDACLAAMNGRRAPLNLKGKFSDFPEGTQHRIQTLMKAEGLIDLVEGNHIGNSALITDDGNALIARYGTFRKYIEQQRTKENEIKREKNEADKMVKRSTIASEKSATWTVRNTIIALGMFLLAALACWQTARANDKDRIIETQKQHIRQLETQLRAVK